MPLISPKAYAYSLNYIEFLNADAMIVEDMVSKIKDAEPDRAAICVKSE